jgi:hypothetical protein
MRVSLRERNLAHGIAEGERKSRKLEKVRLEYQIACRVLEMIDRAIIVTAMGSA